MVIICVIVGITLAGSLKNKLKEEIIQDVKTYSTTLSGTDVVSGAKNMALKFGL